MRLCICTCSACRLEDDGDGQTAGERAAADDPRLGGDPTAPLRQTQLPLRRRDGAARVHGAQLLHRRAQPHGDARSRRGRRGARRDRPLPGRAGEGGTGRQRRPGRAADPPGQPPPGPVNGWLALLGSVRAVFTAPSFAIFTDLLAGWVCAPGRRTVTAMITVADSTRRRAHDAYHRFLRDGAWSMAGLWRTLCVHAVARFAPDGVIELVCDDTLHHKSGRHVDGAGTFRDAVRVDDLLHGGAHGLNLVVICLRVQAPWGGCPIAIPVNARLHRKHDDTTTIAHAANMMREIAGWFPGRDLHLTADGAYATLARDLPE